jgi:L-rhamnose mutarotase
MNYVVLLPLLLVLLFIGCTKSSSPSESISGSGNGNTSNQAGVITAGEWNDLSHWDFWNDLLGKSEYSRMPSHWQLFPTHRISVRVLGTDGEPAVDITVQLKHHNEVVYTARTSNTGHAELWPSIITSAQNITYSDYTIHLPEATINPVAVHEFSQGLHEITIPAQQKSNAVDIAFVVDATGSMGDELQYLKTELLDVIQRTQQQNNAIQIRTSSVFYRDEGDDYVTRISPFTTNAAETVAFIKDQSSSGGGDFPEAVHTALDKALNQLQWSSNARSRILFLVLDAPPHHETGVIAALQEQIQKAAAAGIRIIPIAASGVDKETEFLMRMMAIATQGTYVFITNDSGVGESHLEPTVGNYQVEFLNNLLVRLIDGYTK